MSRFYLIRIHTYTSLKRVVNPLLKTKNRNEVNKCWIMAVSYILLSPEWLNLLGTLQLITYMRYLSWLTSCLVSHVDYTYLSGFKLPYVVFKKSHWMNLTYVEGINICRDLLHVTGHLYCINMCNICGWVFKDAYRKKLLYIEQNWCIYDNLILQVFRDLIVQ